MDTLAAISFSPDHLELMLCQIDEPAENEVLIKVEACGICHTDLIAMSGNLGTSMPAVFGHEGVGIIEKVGKNVVDFFPGERVLASFGACGHCPTCQHHQPAYCQRASLLNLKGVREEGPTPLHYQQTPITSHFFAQSSFASHAIVRTTNLVKLDSEVSAACMAPLACGLLTGASSVVNVLKATPEHSLVVAGCGSVGMAAIMSASIIGCENIIAIDKNAKRVELALSLGATRGFTELDDLKQDKTLFGRIDRGLDTTANAAVIKHLFSALGPMGKLALAGLSASKETLAIHPNEFLFGGKSLIGTVEGNADPKDFVPRMINWYKAGQFPIEKLIKTYPFTHIHDALEAMKRGDVIKPVLTMTGDEI